MTSVLRHAVFVTGGTGYLGKALMLALRSRGHTVCALARPGSERSLPPGVDVVIGNALEAETFAHAIVPADTVVHLVGTPRPSPLKAAQFQAVDLVSIRATVAAATRGSVRHLVYVSVAHPAPVMQAYVAVRQEGEALIRGSGSARPCCGRGTWSARNTGGHASCTRCMLWGSGCRPREPARVAWGW